MLKSITIKQIDANDDPVEDVIYISDGTTFDEEGRITFPVRKTKNVLLKCGMYLAFIERLPSGQLRACGKETLSGKRSSYIFPITKDVTIE